MFLFVFFLSWVTRIRLTSRSLLMPFTSSRQGSSFHSIYIVLTIVLIDLRIFTYSLAGLVTDNHIEILITSHIQPLPALYQYHSSVKLLMVILPHKYLCILSYYSIYFNSNPQSYRNFIENIICLTIAIAKN